MKSLSCFLIILAACSGFGLPGHAAEHPDIFSAHDIAAVSTGPGVQLRELAGRVAALRRDTYSLAEFTLTKGGAIPPCYNKTAEEIVIVAQGRGEVWIDGAFTPIQKGDVIHFRPKSKHALMAAPGHRLVIDVFSLPAYRPDDFVVVAKAYPRRP